MKSNTGSSNKLVWTGRVISALVVLFCVVDGVMKLWKPAPVVQATMELGYRESDIVGIGVALLFCTLIYVLPRTSIVGAILLTGYLGGAVASQVRIGAGWFNVAFPLIIATLAWSGLRLRDPRVRSLYSDILT